MAVICREHRILFIMAPRTGCTAIAEVLRAQLGGEDIPARDDETASRAGVPVKHSTLAQLRGIGAISAAERRELFVFSAVRNPFDSMVSLYVKQAGPYQELLVDERSWINRHSRRRDSVRRAGELDFESWLVATYDLSFRRRLVHLGRSLRGEQNRWLKGVDFVMRYENLQQDFDEALRRAGVDRQLTIPRINVTPGRDGDYRSYYTDRARKIVERLHRSDLQHFGYSF